MSLDVLKACAKGYADRLFDLQLVSVQQGYWAGYYSRTKRPKSVNSVIEKLIYSHTKSSTKKKYTDVDVDAFLKMEEKFNQKLNT